MLAGAKFLRKNNKSSAGMQLSALQPLWIQMILFCWNVKLLEVPRSSFIEMLSSLTLWRPG